MRKHRVLREEKPVYCFDPDWTYNTLGFLNVDRALRPIISHLNELLKELPDKGFSLRQSDADLQSWLDANCIVFPFFGTTHLQKAERYVLWHGEPLDRILALQQAQRASYLLSLRHVPVIPFDCILRWKSFSVIENLKTGQLWLGSPHFSSIKWTPGLVMAATGSGIHGAYDLRDIYSGGGRYAKPSWWEANELIGLVAQWGDLKDVTFGASRNKRASTSRFAYPLLFFSYKECSPLASAFAPRSPRSRLHDMIDLTFARRIAAILRSYRDQGYTRTLAPHIHTVERWDASFSGLVAPNEIAKSPAFQNEDFRYKLLDVELTPTNVFGRSVTALNLTRPELYPRRDLLLN